MLDSNSVEILGHSLSLWDVFVVLSVPDAVSPDVSSRKYFSETITGYVT